MSNKYLGQVEVDVRNKLPSLQGLNIEPHIAKARTATGGFMGKALIDMVGEIAEYHTKLNQEELSSEFRKSDIAFTEAVTKLPPGWAGTDDGLTQYENLLKNKIEQRKQLVEKHRGGVGASFYDEYQMKISESAAQDFLTAQDMRNQYILRDADYKKGVAIGNYGADLSGLIANESLSNKMRNLPPDVITTETVKKVADMTSSKISIISNHPGSEEAQKEEEIRKVLAIRDDVVVKHYVESIMDSSNPANILRIDGVEQYNVETGAPIMDFSIQAKKTLEKVEELQHNLDSGNYKRELIKTYGMSEERAENLSRVARDSFIEKRNKIEREIAIRSDARQKALEERDRDMTNRLINTSKSSESAMRNNFRTRTAVGGAVSLINGGSPFHAADEFKVIDVDGVTGFEKKIGISVDYLENSGLYISDMFAPEHISDVKVSTDAKQAAQIVSGTILKDIPEGNAKRVASRSLAQTFARAGLPFNEYAVDQLSKVSERDQDPQSMELIGSIISGAKNPYDKVPPQSIRIGSVSTETQEKMNETFGTDKYSPDGFYVIMNHVRANQNKFAGISGDFKENLKWAVSNGKVNQSDFELAVISAYESDKNFRDSLDKYAPTTKKLSSPTRGLPLSLSQDHIESIIKNYTDQKVEEERVFLEKHGYKNNKKQYGGASGKF